MLFMGGRDGAQERAVAALPLPPTARSNGGGSRRVCPWGLLQREGVHRSTKQGSGGRMPLRMGGTQHAGAHA